MLLKLCPRCRRPMPGHAAYCQDCAGPAAQDAAQRRASSARKYNQQRDKKLTAFYKSDDWLGLSRGLLSTRKYACEAKHKDCTKLAVEVHHVQPLSTLEGWARRLDPTNCIIVCLNCHNFAHNRFQRGWGRTPGGG